MTERPELISSEDLLAAARRITARAQGSHGSTHSVWPAFIELGFTGLTLAADRGGLGQPFSSLAPVYRELGHSLLASTYCSTMIASEIFTQSVNPENEAILRGLLSGAVLFTVPALGFSQTLNAIHTPTGLLVSGRISSCIDANSATHILSRITVEGQQGWAAIPFDAKRDVMVSPLWDESRSLGDIMITNTLLSPGNVLMDMGVDQYLRLANSHWDISVACDSMGGARRVFDETVAYTKLRRQFGRAIGSFQAIKHRLADLHVELEAADALLESAIANRSKDPSSADEESAAAKYYCCNIYRQVSIESIQLHGGTGFTWEQSSHRFLKRALLNDQLGGASYVYLDRLAVLLLDGRTSM